MEHILFECDFPHSNGSWPDSRRRAWELSSKAGLDAGEVYKLVRGNAIHVYGLAALRDHGVTPAPPPSPSPASPPTDLDTAGTMRPDTWTRAGESGLMARLVALQLVAGQQLESVTAAHGLALGDYLVLAVIRRSPDGVCAPSTVCDVLRRASGGMTLTLDRLEAAGWLTRSPDASDRRRVLLHLTPAGEALTIAVNEDLHSWERSIADRRRLAPLVASMDDLLVLLQRGGDSALS